MTMPNMTMPNMTIQRKQYRAYLLDDIDNKVYDEKLHECSETIKDYMDKKLLLAAGLYYYENMLFFYGEFMSESLLIQDLLKPLVPFLQICPHQEGDRYFIDMVPVFYHALPESVEDWQRDQQPMMQRGRIAYLWDDKIMDYVYHHLALIREGRLSGDKYQFISIHENVLFSYFEEPRTITNRIRHPEIESEAIKDWLGIDPGQHFKPVILGIDSHFTMIEAHWAYVASPITKELDDK